MTDLTLKFQQAIDLATQGVLRYKLLRDRDLGADWYAFARAAFVSSIFIDLDYESIEQWVEINGIGEQDYEPLKKWLRINEMDKQGSKLGFFSPWLMLTLGKTDIGYIRKDFPLVIILESYSTLIPLQDTLIYITAKSFEERMYSFKPQDIISNYEKLNSFYSLMNCNDGVTDCDNFSIYELLWSSMAKPTLEKGEYHWGW